MKAIQIIGGVLVVLLTCNFASAQEEVITKKVAITFDDLPITGYSEGQSTYAEAQYINHNILRHLKDNNVVATGFVNEDKLLHGNETHQWVVMLDEWLKADCTLGNHTFSHPHFNTTPVDSFIADVIKGERLLKEVLGKHGAELCYFRHPFLETGNTHEKKEKLETFLSDNHYTIAPVTVGHFDWLYAAAYMNARGDSVLMKKVGALYLDFLDREFSFMASYSKELIGYEVSHIALFHTNKLNADYFDEVIALLHGKGYEIIPLEEALKDKAYERGDPQASAYTFSWLFRWAVAEGKELPFANLPMPGVFIQELAGISLN